MKRSLESPYFISNDTKKQNLSIDAECYITETKPSTSKIKSKPCKTLSQYFNKKSSHDKNTNIIEIISKYTTQQFKFSHHNINNLNYQYASVFIKEDANRIFNILEKEIEYYTGDLEKIFVYGKWRKIPRKQVAYGQEGTSYTFSGNTFPAKPWIPILETLLKLVNHVSKTEFNFVLINRYKDGDDYIGEHRDKEADLVQDAPITSLSFGAERDFIFRHRDRKNNFPQSPEDVKINLTHGSVLIMNFPTNIYWYHSLPQRKRCLDPRISLTFRVTKI